MINQTKKALSEKATAVIKQVLEERIPFAAVIPTDESSEFVLQSARQLPSLAHTGSVRGNIAYLYNILAAKNLWILKINF